LRCRWVDLGFEAESPGLELDSNLSLFSEESHLLSLFSALRLLDRPEESSESEASREVPCPMRRP